MMLRSTKSRLAIASLFISAVAVTALGVWIYCGLRIQSSICACYGNMLHMEKAKQLWSQQTGVTDGSIDTNAFLNWMSETAFPWHCSLGGVYQLGDLDQEPSCTIHGAMSVAHDHTAAKRIREYGFNKPLENIAP